MKREIILTIIISMIIGSQGFSLDSLFHFKHSCHFACSDGTSNQRFYIGLYLSQVFKFLLYLGPEPQSPQNSTDRIADSGCKAFNISYEFFGDMSDFPDCCDELVECYSQCGVPFEVCNMIFSTCLHESCSVLDKNDSDPDSIISNHGQY